MFFFLCAVRTDANGLSDAMLGHEMLYKKMNELWVYFHLPGDLSSGSLQGSCHRAVFVNGQGACLICLVGIDVSLQLENNMNISPEGGLLARLALAVYKHAKTFHRLALLF